MRSTALAASVLALAIGGVALAQPVVKAAAAKASASGKATILPGQWEYDYKVGVIPVSSESKCLKPADAEQFSRGICTKRYRCDYTTNVVKDGKIQLKGTWTDKKDRVSPVTANGTYSPESFRMDIHIKTISGMNLAGSMDAKRISAECAPEEKSAEKPAEKSGETAAK
jgi:opacity protein-like surface antigen